MNNKIIYIFLIVLLLTACTSLKDSKIKDKTKYCTVNEDCIPASCCHPADTVNKNYAPNCTDSLCTLSCEGPLDCGKGVIYCQNNTCTIKEDTEKTY